MIDMKQQSTQKGLYELIGGVLVIVLGVVYGVQPDAGTAQQIRTGVEGIGALIPVLIGLVQAIVGLHNIRRDEGAEK